MEDLPDEILLRIFKDVDDHSLFKNCSVVCKRWHRILDWNYWASILVSDTNEHAEQYRRLFEQFPQMKQNSGLIFCVRDSILKCIDCGVGIALYKTSITYCYRLTFVKLF